MKRFLLPLLALTLSFASCQSDIDILVAEPEFDAPEITASISDETRTHLSIDGNIFKVYWNEAENISFFSKSDHNRRYEVSSLVNGGAIANFVYGYEYVRGTGTRYSYYYAAYPWSKTNKLVDEVIQLDLPATQTYDATNDFRYVPMVAKDPQFDLSFKIPASVLCVAITKDDSANEFMLTSVTISSASQDLAGRVSVDMSGTEFKAVVDPSLGDVSKSVTLDLGEGVLLTDEAQNFSLALPDVVFPENDMVVTCQLKVKGEQDEEFTSRVLKLNFSQSLAFQAGRIKRLTLVADSNQFISDGGGVIDGEINVDEDMIIDEPLVVPSGKSATLNLGATISLLPTNPDSSLVVIEEGAELTIDGDGAMTTVVDGATRSATRAASSTAFPIVVNGTLRIKGGDFTLNSYATSWLDCGIYIGPNGKLIVEGGTFRSTKGSYIFGHEFGSRPEISIVGGRFEGYDPSDNDFDGEGSNYLEPEYASYYVAEDELVVAERTAEWEVDNSYLLNSILKNGGNATIIDPVDDWAYFVDDNISVNYPVNIVASGDPDKICAKCDIFLATPLNIFADVNIKCDYTEGDVDSTAYAPETRLLNIDSETAIANVYEGATLTLGNATYFGGSDDVSETLFNLYGGNIVVDGGYYTLSKRIAAEKMFVVDANYASESSIVANGGEFYGFNPEAIAFGEEVRNSVPEGKGALLSWDGGHYTIKNKGTFTAASYNVDGLPNIEVNLLITKIQLNPDGPLEDGTNSISQKLAADAWDIIAFQEDFNFHDNLISSMKDIYTFGKHRGTVGAAQIATPADTDGLGFATLNSTSSFANQTFVEFTDKYGGLTSGANDCIKKGFRYYTVTLKGGAIIDVYVTHMNSGNDSGHISARQSQFKQLAEYIVAHDNGRPVLILGDFNARYTRDDFGTYFWANLGDKVKYFSDAWVELVDKYDVNGNLLYAAGEYPDYPSDSLVVTEKYKGEEGDIECTTQGGEVVDKILYINNPNSDVAIFANSFERDMDYTEADHTPVVSEFTYYY